MLGAEQKSQWDYYNKTGLATEVFLKNATEWEII